MTSSRPSSSTFTQNIVHGWDIRLFVDQNYIQTYICGICNKVCRNAVEIAITPPPVQQSQQMLPSSLCIFCEECVKQSGYLQSFHAIHFIRNAILQSIVQCPNSSVFQSSNNCTSMKTSEMEGERKLTIEEDDEDDDDDMSSSVTITITNNITNDTIPGEIYSSNSPMRKNRVSSISTQTTNISTFNCLWTGPLSNLMQHLRNECQFRLVECSFTKYGCEITDYNSSSSTVGYFENNKYVEFNHMKQYQSHHISILLSMVESLIIQLNEQKLQFQQTLEISKLKKNEEIQNIKNEMKEMEQNFKCAIKNVEDKLLLLSKASFVRNVKDIQPDRIRSILSSDIPPPPPLSLAQPLTKSSSDFMLYANSPSIFKRPPNVILSTALRFADDHPFIQIMPNGQTAIALEWKNGTIAFGGCLAHMKKQMLNRNIRSNVSEPFVCEHKINACTSTISLPEDCEQSRAFSFNTEIRSRNQRRRKSNPRYFLFDRNTPPPPTFSPSPVRRSSTSMSSSANNNNALLAPLTHIPQLDCLSVASSEPSVISSDIEQKSHLLSIWKDIQTLPSSIHVLNTINHTPRAIANKQRSGSSCKIKLSTPPSKFHISASNKMKKGSSSFGVGYGRNVGIGVDKRRIVPSRKLPIFRRRKKRANSQPALHEYPKPKISRPSLCRSSSVKADSYPSTSR